MALKRSIHQNTSQPLIHQFLKKSKQNRKVSVTIANNAKTSTSHQCPLCNKHLYGLSTSNRYIHVNMCLDLAANTSTNMHISNKNKPKKFVTKAFNAASLKRCRSHTHTCNRNYNKLNRYYSTHINGYHPTACSKLSSEAFYHEYKILADSNIVIDGFSNHARYAPNNAIYFLTHFHSDHYKGLTDRFTHGLIYCSETSSRLVHAQIGLQSNLRPLPMFEKCMIPDSVPQTFVTLLEANHCPGAVMLLFEMQYEDRIRYHLHCGDARCEFERDSLFYAENNDILSRYYGVIDKLYLDTTYLQNKIDLPRQSDAIQFIVDKCKQYMKEYNDDIVILIGTYSIGKERILEQVAKQCNTRISISKRKQNILNAVYTEKESTIFTNDETETNIHVVAVNEITFSNMWQYKKTKATRVIGFKATGWASNGYQHIKKDRKHEIYPYHQDSMTIYNVPYSEHSSFTELCKFVNDINAKEIIPTVNNRSPLQVQRQIECLDAHKSSIVYEYHDLIEDNGRKQQTLENYNFI